MGAEIETAVELVFEHDGDTYTARRSLIMKTTGASHAVPTGRATLSVTVRGKDGRSKDRGNPQDSLDQILPVDLSSFFFFDGERIEKLIEDQGKVDVARAIKSLLDLDILERAVRHLTDAQKGFEQEVGKASDEVGAKIAADLATARKSLEEETDKRAQCDRNVEGYAGEIGEIERRLRGLEKAKVLQDRRDALNREKRNIEKQNQELNSEIRAIINERSYTLFLSNATSTALDLIEDKRSKGRLPSGISEQFVRDLLKAERCICGTCIVRGEEPYLRLQEVARTGGQPAIETALINLGGTCELIEQTARPILPELNRRFARLASSRGDLARVEEELSEVSEELKGAGSEDIVLLEQRHSDLLASHTRELQVKGEINARIRDNESKVREKEKELLEAETKNDKAKLAKKRVAIAVEVREAIRQMLAMRTEQVRRRLSASVKSVFQKITFKDYVPEIDERFNLRLTKADEGFQGNIARSQGEAQLLSLSFVGTVAHEAFNQQSNEKLLQSETDDQGTGTFYPVVMDSPFGALETEYQQEIAEVLPSLAPQVIIMFSRAQSRSVVESLKSNVSSAYSLNYHTDKPGEKSTTFNVFGIDAPIITAVEDQNEWAEIVLFAEF